MWQSKVEVHNCGSKTLIFFIYKARQFIFFWRGINFSHFSNIMQKCTVAGWTQCLFWWDFYSFPYYISKNLVWAMWSGSRFSFMDPNPVVVVWHILFFVCWQVREDDLRVVGVRYAGLKCLETFRHVGPVS